MKFNIKKFKSNILFFIICISIIVVSLLLSLLGRGNSSIKLKTEDLGDKDIDIKKLVINEIMTSNKGVVTDQKGKPYDYVEIYNGNSHEVNLKNYGLSDEDTGAKWVFPETIVPGNGYVVVNLSGSLDQGLYANFKLKSSGGEVMTLYKPNGKVVDAVETISLKSNTVMARNADGTWVVQEKATPGFANNNAGFTSFVESLVSNEEAMIQINEFLPENRGNFKNSNGEYVGYIEVINTGDKTIDLENYSLSNSESVSFKWQFPSIKLSSGDVAVVFTTGKSNYEGELCASFKLNNKNGVVVLTNNSGKVIDKVEYENLANGVAYIKVDGVFNASSSISPGYTNTIDGVKAFQKKYLSLPKDLIITEAMNSNYKYLAQNGGNYYDWIELYNNSGKTIKLGDYCLTTSAGNVCDYKLPDIELEKEKYYVIMASGDTNLSNNKYKHANFKLSETESIYLMKDRTIIDTLFLNDIPKGYSFGKDKKGGLYFYSKPTPRSDNSGGSQAISSTPVASVPSGIFDDSKSFNVALSGSGKIYYTLDGSKPTTSSKVYSSPLKIKKTTVLRIMSKEDGKLSSSVSTYSYIVNEGHHLPVISLAINNSDFNTVNNNPGSNYLKPVSAELLEHDGTGFKIEAGLKLFGGSTRYYRKKSYELKFKKEFGPSKLNYPVFDTVDSSVYNSLVLRTGSQDEFEWSKRNMIRDIVATSLMKKYTNVDVQAYKPCVVYINGKYWGLYFIREKIDETLVSNHYNVATTKSDTDIIRIDGEVKTGNRKKFNSLVSFMRNNSLSSSSNYKKVKEQVDIEAMCDFWIAEIFATNYDMLNVRYFRNSHVDDGKWKPVFYDMDSAYYNVSNNYFTFYGNSAGIGMGHWSNHMYVNLMKSSEFKKKFVERLSYNMNNTWKYSNVSKRIDEVIKEIGKDEIKRNLSRWNNISYSQWEKNVSAFKSYAKQRPSIMINQAKSYFNLSSSEVKKYFGDL